MNYLSIYRSIFRFTDFAKSISSYLPSSFAGTGGEETKEPLLDLLYETKPFASIADYREETLKDLFSYFFVSFNVTRNSSFPKYVVIYPSRKKHDIMKK